MAGSAGHGQRSNLVSAKVIVRLRSPGCFVTGCKRIIQHRSISYRWSQLCFPQDIEIIRKYDLSYVTVNVGGIQTGSVVTDSNAVTPAAGQSSLKFGPILVQAIKDNQKPVGGEADGRW